MKRFHNNFKQLFAFPGKICHCHRRRLTCASIFEHENVDFEEWFTNLLDAKIKKISKKKKLKLAAIRRQNQRFVSRLIQRAQQLIYNPQAPDLTTAQEVASQPQPEP
jgi:hypothetical protein